MKRAFLILVFLFVVVPATVPQAIDPPQPRSGDATAGTGPWTREQLEEMRKKQAELRQKQLKDDTTKLLQLATELKESVDKTNEHVLSLEVIKKSEEIEKLAKHIKTNMRDEAR
jgi:hypothetical protein